MRVCVCEWPLSPVHCRIITPHTGHRGLISPVSAVIAIIATNIATQYETSHTHPHTHTYTQLNDRCFLHFPDLILSLNENQVATTAWCDHIHGLSCDPLFLAVLLTHKACLSLSAGPMTHDCWSMAAPMSFLTSVNLWLFCWHLTGDGPQEEECGHGGSTEMLSASHQKQRREQSWLCALHKI